MSRTPLWLTLFLAGCGGGDAPGPAEPADARTLIQRAQQVAGTGDTPEAAALLEQALALDPSHAGAWHRLGEMRVLSGLPGALEALDRAAALGLDSARFHQTRGEALEAEGQDREAALAFVAALEREPIRGEAWFRLAQTQRRLGQDLDADASLAEFERLKLAEQRAVQLEAAAAAAPGDPRVAAAAATARLELLDLAGASRWVDRAFELDGDSAEAHQAAGRLAALQGDPVTAEVHFELVIASSEHDPRPWMELALLSLAAGDSALARERSLEATRRAEADPSVFLAHARVLAALDDLVGAVGACDDALLRDNGSAEAASLRTALLEQIRQREGR
jgi:tetratricopeptide (TPR) repeat protein